MTDNANPSNTTPLKMGGRIVIDLSHGAYTSVATALKEYISNGWDAGAANITLRIFNPETPKTTRIEIQDDGSGMTHEDLVDKFFRIGRDRRREEGAIIDTIRGKRRLHGRKGLGKLAGLKMANILRVITWTKTSLESAYISLDEIEKNPNSDPLVHWEPTCSKPLGACEKGTIIRLEKYSRTELIDVEQLRKLLSLWFEFGSEAKVTLEQRKGVGSDAELKGQWDIARSNIFQKLRTETNVLTVAWKEGRKKVSKKVKVKWGELDNSDTTVRSLISVFSGTRALSTEETFDIKKGWTNMFGIYKLVAVFQADWLDQMNLDPADIKREGINWDLTPALQSFRDVGAQWLKNTCASMARSDKGKKEIRTETERLVNRSKRFRRWSETKRAKLIDIVSNYASREGFSTDELDKLVELFAFVLENGALIHFLQSLKESGKKDIEGFMEFAQDFTAVEITGLLQVTKSKLELVNELARLISDPSTLEVARPGRDDITTFLAKSPWIFDPELRIDHKNITIKRIVMETEGSAETEINRLPKEYFNIRPDFVGYLSPAGTAICIELKKPNKEMSKAEAQRILDYRAALMDKFEKIRIVAVSGSFSKDAEKLLRSIDGVELMHYVTLLEKGQNQLSDFIKKLEKGLSSVDPKEEKKK